MWTYEVVQVF